MNSDLALHIGIQCNKCKRCNLHRIVSHKVGPEGSINAKLIIIGEAPGPDEYKQLRPFIGVSGKLLRRTLKLTGFKPEDYYITNAVKCFPNINGKIVKPTIEAITKCYPILTAEIDAIMPKAILVLGNVAYQSVVDNKSRGGITKLAGSNVNIKINGNSYKVFILYHPSYVLRANNKEFEIKFLNIIKEVYDYVCK